MKKILSLFLCFACMISIITPIQATDEVIKVIEDSVITSNNEAFAFQYEGDGWQAESGYTDLFHNGDDHYSNTLNDYFTFKFYGTKIEIYGSKNKNHGVYSVSVDDVAYDDIDALVSGETQHQQLLTTIDGLAEGEHTLKVVNKGPKAIQIDYIKVYHGDIIATGLEVLNHNVKLEVEGTSQINYQLTPSYATKAGEVSYESLNEEIATVSATGLITAVALGTTTVNVLLDGEVKDQVNVNVLEELAGINVTLSNPSLLEQQDDYATLSVQSELDFSDVAWKNDVVTSKIVVATLDLPIDDIEVSVSDFVSGEHVISASNIEATWLKEVNASIGRGNTTAPVQAFPDIISFDKTKSLAANTLGFVWVEINVPKDCVAGTYKGEVSIKAKASKTPIKVNYTIDVIDIAVPEECLTEMQIWQHPFSQAGYLGLSEEQYFSEEHFEYMRSSLEEYAAMGSRDLVANIVDEAWGHQSYFGDATMVAWTKKTDGTFTFDYTMFEKWINFADECGVIDMDKNIGQIKCYSIVPWNNRITYYDEATQSEVTQNLTVGSDEWSVIWTQFLKDFVDYTQEKGIFDMIYIAMDERSLDMLRPTADLIESIKNKEGKSFKIFSAFNYDGTGDYTFTDRIHDVSLDLGRINHNNDVFRDFVDHRKELGLTTTIYTCTGDYPGNFIISDPGDNYWLMWYTMTQHADGYMKWAWDNWVADPINSPNYKSWEPGDGWYIYPVEKENMGEVNFYSTPRYEMMKEGIRDVNKAKYLMSINTALATMVEDMVSTLDRGNKGFAYGSATYANETERMITINEGIRMHKEIDALAKQYVENDGNIVYKGRLEALINQANTTNTKNYTEASVKALIDAIESAQAVYDKEKVTQAEIDEQITLLETALLNLEMPKLDETTLINTEANKDLVTISSFSSECNTNMEGEGVGSAASTLDYNDITYWHSNYNTSNGEKHYIVYNLGDKYHLSDIQLLPRQKGTNGDIFAFNLYVSEDATVDENDFVESFEFESAGSTLANRNMQRAVIREKAYGQYVKIEVIHSGGDELDQYCSLAEIRFYGTKNEPVVQVNKEALRASIAAAEKVDTTTKTAESVAILASALAAAKEIDAKADATQAQVDEAKAALEEAMNQLEEVKPKIPFVDVEKNQWYYNVIQAAYDKGLMQATGLADPNHPELKFFEPDTPISRGMVATVLYRMAGQPKVEFKATFSDVTNAKLWYSTAITWASQANVVSGYKDGSFGPDDNITRQDLAIMLRNFAKANGLDTNAKVDFSAFKDGNKVVSYAQSAVAFCIDTKLMSGSKKADGLYLNPRDNATRAECAKMFSLLDDAIKAK